MPTTEPIHSCAVRLAKSEHLHCGRFKDFVKELLALIASTTDVDRTSFWMYHPHAATFQIVAAYDGTNASFISEGKISEDSTPGFFHLALNKYLHKAEDTSIHKEIVELRAQFMPGNPARSMLTHQVIYDGKILGIICFEQVLQPRYWSGMDELEIGSAASMIQQAYQISLNLNGTVDRESLFYESPVPVWVFDTESLEILDGNKKALELYDYSELSSFIGDQVMNLVHPSHRDELKELLEREGANGWKHAELIQQRKDGLAFMARLCSTATTYKGSSARIVVVIESNKEKEIEKEKSELEKRLYDHAFYASHNLRSPLANILGLLDLIKISWDDRENYEELLFRLKIQTMNLDEAVRVMSAKIEMDHLSSGV